MKNQIETIEDLRKFLKDYFKNRNVTIYLFGSRAVGKESIYSDIDLAFETEEDIDKDLAIIRDILEESLLPYKVDLVDLKDAPYLAKTIKSVAKQWV
ncbi:nucleotidyltransferase domain-containing protein [Hydrogenobaculum acidophilum]